MKEKYYILINVQNLEEKEKTHRSNKMAVMGAGWGVGRKENREMYVKGIAKQVFGMSKSKMQSAAWGLS